MLFRSNGPTSDGLPECRTDITHQMKNSPHMKLCKNCETRLEGPFCLQCGQRDVDLDRPLPDLLAEVAQETLDADGRLISTLKALFRRPGFLTAEFLAGRRQSFTPPFRLYLAFSLLFFLVAAWAVSHGMMLSEGQTLAADAPGQASFVSDELPRLMFLLLPVFALLLKAAFWRRQYFDHLIHSLHIHSAAFVILAVMLPMEDAANQWWWALVLQLAMTAYLLIYLAASVRRVYRANWWITWGKSLAILFVYINVVAGASELASYLTMPAADVLPFLTD